MKPVYKTDADPDWKPIPGDLNIVSCNLKGGLIVLKGV